MDGVIPTRVTHLHNTMGYAKVPKKFPENFLKKHSKETKLPKKQPFRYKNPTEDKPPIPKFDLKNDEQFNMSKNKNFIVDNDYGQVPYYLKMRKRDLVEAQEMYNKYITTRAQQEQSMMQIQEEEKRQLLQGLRENWHELNGQYLSMSLVVDSFKKKLQKEMLEQQLKRLEKCMETLQNDIVYVSI